MKALKPIWYLALMFVFLSTEAAWSAVVAGKISAAKGSVTATGPDGTKRKLRKGKAFYEGDKIDTAKRGAVAMKFKDGTKFALGGESSMQVDAFVFGVSPEEDKVSVKVLKGAFRFITGLVAKKKPENMGVTLGVTATIGIRGTNAAGELIGESVTVVLLEPEGDEEGTFTAIEVYNDFGQVTIDEPGFGTEVADSKSAPTPAKRMKLRTVDNIMRSMSSITRAFSRPRVSVP